MRDQRQCPDCYQPLPDCECEPLPEMRERLEREREQRKREEEPWPESKRWAFLVLLSLPA